MLDKIIINTQYNIPRYIVSKPGKQNRACTGEMHISPGITEPFEFQYSNMDGVPINLTGFMLRIVFWFPQTEYESLSSNFNSNIILAKDATIEDPYSGTATILLTDQETLVIGQGGRSTIRWSIYMISPDGDVFPTQITSNGARYGACYIDRSDLPNAETIKGISLSINSNRPAALVLPGVAASSAIGSFTVET